MDDAISQSQSSNSSHCKLVTIQILAISEQEQRSVRSFKEHIKEQKSPFFARCFVKLGVLIFLLVLASASKFLFKN